MDDARRVDAAEIELWSARRVAVELGLPNQQSVWWHARRGKIPAPLAVDGNGWVRVWLASEIRAFRERGGV